jgi:signal transduction histidine kinase
MGMTKKGAAWRRFRLRCVRHALAALALLAVGAAPALPAPPAEDALRWRVVLIRGWDAQHGINALREKPMLAALLDDSPRAIEMYYEEVDTMRFGGEVESEMTSLMRAKYSDRTIDLVIASGVEPLEFAARHRDEIWPGAAIVFYGVEETTPELAQLPARTTGVTFAIDVRGTVELARALLPQARDVYFVAGTSAFDQRHLEQAKAAAAEFKGKVEPHYIAGLTRDDTLAAVGRVEREAIVIFLSLFRDGAGQFSVPGTHMVTRVSEASHAPVLATLHSQAQRGPIGGSFSRLDEHGRAAGLLARRLLQGAAPESIAMRLEPSPRCIVDARPLQRWNLLETGVPGSCEVLNGFSQGARRYFWPIMALLAIVVLQMLLIWMLIIQRRQRLGAEAEAHQQQAELNNAARFALGGVLTTSIAHEINQPLGAIMGNADAAAIILRSPAPDIAELREIVEEIRSEDMRASEVVRRLRALLSRREMQGELLDVNAATAEALRHVSYDVARHDARLTPVFASDLPSVVADSVHLQQAIINLVMNAVEAMDAVPQRQREVRVETGPRDGGVEISVIDNGPGIDEAHRASLFESIFTTKEKGAGLGLSIVRAIVDAHRGRVSAEPGPTRGAIFRMWLPAAGT